MSEVSDLMGQDLDAQLTQLRGLYERGLLSEANYRAALVGLGVDPATVFDQREQRVEQQINVAGDFYAAPPGPPPPDEDTALARYLRHVVQVNRCLQLQGIRSAGGLVSIDLEEIYVTLSATVRKSAAVEETWLEEMGRLAPGEARRLAHRGAGEPREMVQQVKVQVQEALAMHPHLVVLGDPGSGKTTLLRYLALTYARDLAGETGLAARRLGLDEQRLPILLPLRDLAGYLATNCPDPSTDGPKLLLDFLRAYCTHQDIALPERFFADRLEGGACVVLLDGVDEVADFPARQRVARLIERFTVAYPDNRYVVTSRIVGYSGGARLGADYALTTVRDFGDADVERFVSYWNRAVEVALAREETPYVLRKAEQEAQKLWRAIQSKDRVRELAVNPLLLTVIALVQRYRAELPERRTELYEEALEVLLAQWDAVKGLSATAVLQGLELDAGDRRGLLEPVALWMMEQRAREIEAVELRRQLGERFFAMCGDRQRSDKAVAAFLRLIDERSGLLAERGQGMYAFSHLTFQEHLAARAVADRADYVAYTLAHLGNSWWRETILLEAGYLSTQGKRRVTELLQAIMDHREEAEAHDNLVLAAEALRDVGPARVTCDLGGEIQRRLRKEFEAPLRKPRADDEKRTLTEQIRRRAAAAEALARIESGGPGTQPAFWRLPHGEPVWVDVPAGKFWMGSERGDSDERPVHRVHLERFLMARVPITNAQYRFFVEATGHRPPGRWEDGRLPRGQESHPVVYVSWHDALAYCLWLSEVTGKSIVLPSEAQWEKAARGDKDKREYPWGDVWDETKCNTHELGLEGTTPVGIFPEGASPYGCLDMAGNVWEWTRSLWGHWTGKEAKLQFGYPYDPADGRENLEAGDDMLRVLRGGSWDYNQLNARCADRSSGSCRSTSGSTSAFGCVSPPSLLPLCSDTRQSGALEKNSELRIANSELRIRNCQRSTRTGAEMDGKLMDILSQDQCRALENVRAAAGRIWARPLHRYYTDHSVAHSERVIALLDGLTAGLTHAPGAGQAATEKRLSPNEVWILLAAAYLHDVGMQNENLPQVQNLREVDLDLIRAQHHAQTAEMIYAVFEDPANAFPIPLAGDPALVEAVALVARGHRRVDLASAEYEPLAHGGETLRLRLLAALLRFADELDVDHRRVDLAQMKLLTLSVESQLHWWKCHYVAGVSIADGYICVGYRFPQDRPDYEGLIVPLVEGEIRAKLAELEEILWAHGVKVALGKPQVRLMRLVQPLPPEVEALARREAEGGVRAAGRRAGTAGRSPVSPAPRRVQAEAAPAGALSGAGALAQDNSVAAGAGGVAVGGDVQGDVVTGVKTTVFDQRGQTVGTQINVAGDYVAQRPTGGADAPNESAASLERQLAEAEANLALIRERKAQYVLEVDVPLQLVKEERRLLERIVELKAELGSLT